MQDAHDIWGKALADVRERIPSPGARAWIENARPVSLSADTITVAASSAFAKDWLETRYRPLLTDALSGAAGRAIDVLLTVDDAAHAVEESPPAEPVLVEEPAPVQVSGMPRPAPAVSGLAGAKSGTPAEPPALNAKYQFETFVIGPSNRFAHAAAMAVAEQPARSYNPLFIYGEAGLGKTHLLHAIGHEVHRLYPAAVVRYVSSEQFMNEFIQSVREEKMPSFRRRYREADVLLIDDIQFMARGEQTQEEFFHTFNALHNDGRQIVISSDRPPQAIAPLEDRLRTRFEWGLITDIQPPDLETRVAILQKKAFAEGFSVPDEVLEFIAGRVQNNIRELEGRLIRVVSYASLSQVAVTLDLAREVLRPLLPAEESGEIPPDLIINTCAEYFDLTRDELMSPSRSRNLVTARQYAMYLCRELTALSLPKIGECFGGRDHTTVMHADNKIRTLMGEKRAVYAQIQELTARIRQKAGMS